MTIPGARRIDPGAEADRLACERADPPGREWGIRHPGGRITVRIDGRAFQPRAEAEAVRETCDQGCLWCPGGTHALVCRDDAPWREP